MIDLKISAKNQICGRIVEIIPGPTECMIKVDIFNEETGTFIYSSVPVDQVDELGLNLGDKVYCVFTASSVLIGK